MAFTLYDASVRTYLQILGAVSGLVDKAEAFAAARNLDPKEVLEARLAPDMFNFAKQVEQCVHHSVGSLEGVRAGQFSPSLVPPPADFASLKALVENAIEQLKTVVPDEVNFLADKDTDFVFGERRMPFTGADFLMSFSLPNFYFHATASYAILRMLGADVGKRDFMGMPRMKPRA